MSPGEIIALITLSITILSGLIVIISKVVSQGNKIIQHDKDINNINKNVAVLENKQDKLEEQYNEIKADLRVLTEVNQQVLNDLSTIVQKHDEKIEALEKHVAVHRKCKNIKIDSE